MTIPEAFDFALSRHRAGRLVEAEALYRQILAVQPDHADALHFLGVIAHQAGRHDLAVEIIRKSISSNPNNPSAHSTLGNALSAQGRLDEAMAAYRRAIEIGPDYPDAHNNLGNMLVAGGHHQEAIGEYRRAIQVKPDYPDAHNNLGNALREIGQFDEAAAACRRALELRPNFAEAHVNLGSALRERGEFDEATASFRRALELRPDFPEALTNLGNALAAQGRLDEAVNALRRALEVKPDYPEGLTNLGNVLAVQGHLEEAIAASRRALEVKPEFPEACVNLGNFLREQGRPDEGVAACRRALQIKPNYPEALNNLGNALKDRGELDEAIAAYRDSLELKPEHTVHSNLILALHHLERDERIIAHERQRWNRRFGDPLKESVRPHSNSRDPKRRLRVGYVSADFRDHPVGRYALPLLRSHDQEQVAIFCYSGVLRSDWLTDQVRALHVAWRPTMGVLDAPLAEMIRTDEIDILVDLAMHTAGTRLPVFARRPAPVQASWLAYPGSTDLDGIGYRLTDAHMDPRGMKPDWSTEEPVRLPDCWCCYEAVGEFPAVSALPALSADGMTFGSLNNFAKVNEGVMVLWARVMKTVNGSRLLMLCPEGTARERVRAFFRANDVAGERIEFVCSQPRRDYLRLYQRIDVALDPFPFNGMTTTCDALWMGVPTLTMPGGTPVSRAGLSILSSVGLPEFAASCEEEYVRMAVALAADLPRLANLRATMRSRMKASPLMDAPRFARNVESAYRSMWRAWCEMESPTQGKK